MSNIFHIRFSTFIVLGMCLFFCSGCTSSLQSSKSPSEIASTTTPDEKVYVLQQQKLKIPISRNEALVYRFDVQIPTEGLYAFETLGKADTLCALVAGRGESERFILVKDSGGEKENCKIIWAFPKGRQQFKVRVDGRGHFQVRLKRMGNQKLQDFTFTQHEPNSGVLKTPNERHQYSFTLKSARFIQFKAKGQGPIQCILRNASGNWLKTAAFRQNYGTCTFGTQLKKGQYHIEVRGNNPNTKYTFRYEEVRKQLLLGGHVKPGNLQANASDIYQLQLSGKQRYILRTHSKISLSCTLEYPLGHVIQRESDGNQRSCLLKGYRKKGTYFLRVRLTNNQKTGSYLVSFQQQDFKQIHAGTKRTIQPDFQGSMQLYHIKIKHPRLYQIKVHGRAVQCRLQSITGTKISSLHIPEKDQCMLFTHLQQGEYFLEIYPLKRSDNDYTLAVHRYQPPKGEMLLSNKPHLLGPSSPGFYKKLQVELKQPQILVLETHGHQRLSCKLYDANNRMLSTHTNEDNDKNCRLMRYLNPGKYTLRIRVLNGSRNRLFWVRRKAKKIPWIRMGEALSIKFAQKKKPKTYLMKVVRPGLYGIRTEGKVDTICKLLNQDWGKLAEDDDAGTNNNCFLARFLRPGIYPMQISAHQRPGPLKLLVAQHPLHSLPPGQKLERQIGYPHWMNFYKIHIKQSGRYTLKTFGSLDTNCRLLNFQGKKVAVNDDATHSNKNCKIDENLRPGYYLFEVKLYQKDRSARKPQLYRVLFNKKKMLSWKLEVDKFISGRLRTGEKLHFTFKIKHQGRYRIQTQGGADPKCTLYRSTMRQLAEDDDGGPQRNCLIELLLLPGNYILQIKPAYKRGTGHFRLVLRFRGRS